MPNVTFGQKGSKSKGKATYTVIQTYLEMMAGGCVL